MGSQPKAYLDHTFLKSEDARPIRILAEYLEPQRRFKVQNIQDTVVFFGSARIHSREYVLARSGVKGEVQAKARLSGRLPKAKEAQEVRTRHSRIRWIPLAARAARSASVPAA